MNKKILRDHADKVAMDTVELALYITICKMLGMFVPNKYSFNNSLDNLINEKGWDD